MSTSAQPLFNARLGSDFEQAGRGDGEGGTESHKRVEGRGEMTIFYAVNGLAVDSRQFGKAGLAEVVFGSQAEKAVGKLGTHVLDVALEQRFAWFGNGLFCWLCSCFGCSFRHVSHSTN